MKKWLLILLAVVAIFFFSAYILIPQRLTISIATLVKANPQASSRYLSQESNWQKIFGREVGENSFGFNQFRFTLKRHLDEGVQVLISNEESSDSSLMELVRINYDSSLIRWTASVETSSNPFKKVAQYFGGNTMRQNMQAAVDTIKRFLENEENVYGIRINRSTVKDTML